MRSRTVSLPLRALARDALLAAHLRAPAPRGGAARRARAPSSSAPSLSACVAAGPCALAGLVRARHCALLATTLLVAGCGGGDDKAAKTTGTTPPATTQPKAGPNPLDPPANVPQQATGKADRRVRVSRDQGVVAHARGTSSGPRATSRCPAASRTLRPVAIIRSRRSGGDQRSLPCGARRSGSASAGFIDRDLQARQARRAATAAAPSVRRRARRSSSPTAASASGTASPTRPAATAPRSPTAHRPVV